MKRSFILPSFLLVLLVGCVSDKEARDLDRRYFWSNDRDFAAFAMLSAEYQWANDPAQARVVRARAVAQVFSRIIEPGFSTEQMRSALPDARWLKECSIMPYDAAGGGSSPILSHNGWSNFILRLFPDASGWSDWCIIFQIPYRESQGPRTPEEALAFLSGAHPDKRLRLGEFAVWYPLCGSRENPLSEGYVTQRFTGKRVGIMLTAPAQ
jgi:hypothetical protein